LQQGLLSPRPAYLELKPSLAGQFHLGVKEQASRKAIGKQDSPEVQGVAWPQFGRTGAAAPEADPSHQFVKKAS